MVVCVPPPPNTHPIFDVCPLAFRGPVGSPPNPKDRQFGAIWSGLPPSKGTGGGGSNFMAYWGKEGGRKPYKVDARMASKKKEKRGMAVGVIWGKEEEKEANFIPPKLSSFFPPWMGGISSFFHAGSFLLARRVSGEGRGILFDR